MNPWTKRIAEVKIKHFNLFDRTHPSDDLIQETAVFVRKTHFYEALLGRPERRVLTRVLGSLSPG